MNKTKVLMVCLGNICRSPLAEGLFRHKIKLLNLDTQYYFDSAGTINNHVGDLADPRSREVAKKFGFELTHRGRQLIKNDFIEFDQILVMDESNLTNALKLVVDENLRKKVKIITEFDESTNKLSIVPDPYFGEIKGFVDVYHQLENCFNGWIKLNKKATL